MYGSPFPKLNPNVRYKTALERAGFDVNSGSKRVISGSSVTAPTPKAKSPPLKKSVSPNAVNNKDATPITTTIQPVVTNNNNISDNSQHISEVHSSVTPQKPNADILAVDDDLPENPYAKARKPSPPTSSRNSNHSRDINNDTNSLPLQQEQKFIHPQAPPHNIPQNTLEGMPQEVSQVPHAQQHVDPLLINPIEKSFQMLTQNDTSMSLNSNTSEEIDRKSNILDNNIGNSDYGEERENSDFVPEIEPPRRSSLRESNPSEKTDSRDIEDDIDADLNLEPELSLGSGGHDDISDTESLEFNPNADLSAHLDDDEGQPVDYGKDINLDDPMVDDLEEDIRVKSLRLDDDLNDTHSLNHNDEPSQQFVELKSRTFQRIGDPENKKEDDHEPVEDSQPMTATNLQVEKLIAQLDDVSLSRNAEINTLGGTQDNNILSAAPYPGSSDIQRNQSRLKKSSAYLSGYPMELNNDIEKVTSVGQNVATSNRSSNSSQKSDPRANSNTISPGNGTPVFYKFNQPSPGDFGSVESLNRTQHDNEFLGTPSKVNKELDTNNVEIPSLITEDFSGHTHDAAPEIKYPPGEGPCRRCKLEITGKRIYSKKNNELSGQWHRECFQCTKCSTTFSKTVPCYILNDQIYCQEHYHEENNSICRVCRKFIEGECLENDKIERFHMHCLTCVLCKKIITNDYYIFNGEIPLCVEHDIEQLLNEGLMDDALASNTEVDAKNTLSRRRTRLINFNEN